MLPVADGEAVQAVVGFRPPAIQHREIQAAVQHHLLAAGAGGFQRPPRIVQPDVHALHEVAADVDVVVFDEDELVGELRIAHQLRRSAAAPACRARRADAPCRQTRTARAASDR